MITNTIHSDVNRRDLAGHDDVNDLLTRFYGRALVDDVLAEPFAAVRVKGLDTHLPVMCDFWETVLFSAGRYRGNALTVHRGVHTQYPLSARHFVRWLNLWHETVDESYRGPVATRAKVQAGRIAWAMHRRLTGCDAPELDAFLAAA